MTTNRNIEKRLWMSVVIFITYLFLGSFIISKNIYDIGYLVFLYGFIIFVKIIDRSK